MKTGLILVDIQKDYFKGGKYALAHPELAAMKAKRVLDFFREKAWPIYHVRHISLNPNAAFFAADTEGAEFYQETSPLDGEAVIIKHKPDSFLGTGLKEALEREGINTLVVCGMMTHMCIDTTVRAAAGHGYAVTLIEDACATRDLEWKGKSLPAEQVGNAYMAAIDGSFATVLSADEWLKAQA